MRCVECGDRYQEDQSTVQGHCPDCARALVRAWVALDDAHDAQERGR